jgi:hypothetical protein
MRCAVIVSIDGVCLRKLHDPVRVGRGLLVILAIPFQKDLPTITLREGTGLEV